jgi:hypothetical protein
MNLRSIILILCLIALIIYIYQLLEHRSSISIENKNKQIVSMFENDQIEFKQVDEKTLKQPIKKHQAFYDPYMIYPEFKNIDYDIIVQELENYMMRDTGDWQDWPEYNLWNKNGDWKIIPIFSFGSITFKSQYFPKTLHMFKDLKVVNMGFSKFAPGTRLKMHKGWGNLSNNVLRCHYGIDVPDKCYLYVIDPYGNNMMQQENKKWIVFDDSLYHSAENKSDRDRIVLIIDIERPEYLHKGISDIQDTEELKSFIEAIKK